MASIVTTISLCPKSHAIAKKLNNLSEFVRNALFLHAGDKESMHTMKKHRRVNGGYRISEPHLYVEFEDGHKQHFSTFTVETQMCDPFDKEGQCPVCWPPMNGPIHQQVAAVKARLQKEALTEMYEQRIAHEAEMAKRREAHALKMGEEE